MAKLLLTQNNLDQLEKIMLIQAEVAEKAQKVLDSPVPIVHSSASDLRESLLKLSVALEKVSLDKKEETPELQTMGDYK